MSSTRTFREGLVDRCLSPGESLSEILFGLIMTLTFTLGGGVLVREDPGAARELLLATVGASIGVEDRREVRAFLGGIEDEAGDGEGAFLFLLRGSVRREEESREPG